MDGDRLRVYRRFAWVIATAVGLDQLTKWLVSHNATLARGDQIPVFSNVLGVHFHLVFLHNEGAAWGIFAGRQYLLATISVVVFAGMIYFYRSFTGGWREREFAVGMILGGIVGNFIDRIWQPGVIDFLRFFILRGEKIYEWPSFNIADSAICVGVGIYCLSSFLRPETPAMSVVTATTATEPVSASPPASTAVSPATPPDGSSTPDAGPGTPRS